jgi:hypothetical protein
VLGDAGAARRALERALDLAEPECLLFPFLYDPEAVEQARALGLLAPKPFTRPGDADSPSRA